MPNLVDNILNLVGPHDRIAQLHDGAKANNFLQTVKPLSEYSLEQATQKWGVKWEIQNPLVSMHNDEDWYGDDKWCLSMQFESPWSPPTGAYRILNEEGLDVCAYFMDTGGGDYGGTYRNGELLTYELKDLPAEVIHIFNKCYDFDHIMNVA